VIKNNAICLPSKRKKNEGLEQWTPASPGMGEYAGVGTAAVSFSDQQMYCIGTSQKVRSCFLFFSADANPQKYILFRNHLIATLGHLCRRTLFRQRSKQNLFFWMTT
jgi:hypothetical protein